MKRKYYFYISILVLLNISCIPAKKVKYLQSSEFGEKSNSYSIQTSEYQLQKGDNVFIELSSLDFETGQILSPAQSNIATIGTAAKYKNIFLIDQEGMVLVPHLGKVFVENLTIQEVHDSLYYRLNQLYNQINLQVRLADGFVTILGEVNVPGKYQIDFKDKMNVFEILGLAGDLTLHANRKEIKIIRKINNENKVFLIDLTSQNVLADENYYLQANDIVYVEPLKAVFWDSKSFPFLSTVSIVLSTVASLLVIFTYSK